MLARPHVIMLLTQQIRQLRAGFQRRRRTAFHLFHHRKQHIPTLICVAFQSLWTLCSAPGLLMQY
jgi:hypothetical protein